MTRQRDWLLGLGIAGVTIVLILIMMQIIYRRQNYDGAALSSRGDKVAVIELFGTIFDSRQFVRQLREFGDHRSVKAIVFRVESPGGVSAATQEIYEALRRVRDGGKPVIVSMGNVAASGGYYIACGADTIVANPGTTTGSIGVIVETFNISELLKKIGIRFEVIKSGRYKDILSPYRDMTLEERKYMQAWVDDAYKQFVDVVASERELSKDKVLRLADGRVFTGKQAKELGLVDILGDYEYAVQLAADLGGIKGEPVVVKERQRRPTVYDFLFQKLKSAIHGMNGMILEYRMSR